MSEPSSNRHQKWAVLIGIDHYQIAAHSTHPARRNEFGQEIQYGNLEGCVNDVLATEKHLVESLKIEPDRIKKLLAPVPDRVQVAELPENLIHPTYANIVDALKVPQGARKGDFVYIHFSGHGGRASTIFDRTVKDSKFDEALIPADVVSGGKYLRDLELGMLLQKMDDFGLVVTVVLDCCHSGGAVRAGEENNPQLGDVRGIEEVYYSDQQRDQPENLQSIRKFGRKVMSPWRRTSISNGVVVVAACLEDQKAREISSGHKHGLLTHCLLETFSEIGGDVSSQALYERICATVQTHNKYQMPFFVGNEDRFFFSKTLRPRIYTLKVTTKDIYKNPQDRRVRLGGGDAHGVKEKSVYAILPLGFDLTQRFQKTDILARARVIAVEIGDCEAEIEWIDEDRREAIMAGCPAVLQQVPDEEKFTVALLAGDTPRDIQGLDSSQVNTVWLRFDDHDSDDEARKFVVVINAGQEFEIRRAPGDFATTRWDKLSPLPAGDLPKLLRRLDHIAQFEVIKNLGVFAGEPLSRDSHPALVEVKNGTGVRERRRRKVHPAELAPWNPDSSEQNYDIEEHTWFRITVKNTSPQRLGCVILNCGADFSVQRLYPYSHNELFKVLGVEEEIEIPIVLSIAEEQRQSGKAGAVLIDTLKVIVSSPEISLDSLTLPGLPEADSFMRAGKFSESDIRVLLAKLDMTRPGYVLGNDAEPLSWEITDIRMRVFPTGHKTTGTTRTSMPMEEQHGSRS